MEFYGKSGIEAKLIDLQDRLGLDVNLLLFACWTGATGRGRLSDNLWRKLISGTEEWRRKVVEPLRAVRRYSKGTVDAGAFREKLKALELEAERAEQETIMSLAQPPEPAAIAADAVMADVVANLRAYIVAAGCPLELVANGAVQVLVAAACDLQNARTGKKYKISRK